MRTGEGRAFKRPAATMHSAIPAPADLCSSPNGEGAKPISGWTAWSWVDSPRLVQNARAGNYTPTTESRLKGVAHALLRAAFTLV